MYTLVESQGKQKKLHVTLELAKVDIVTTEYVLYEAATGGVL